MFLDLAVVAISYVALLFYVIYENKQDRLDKIRDRQFLKDLMDRFNSRSFNEFALSRSLPMGGVEQDSPIDIVDDPEAVSKMLASAEAEARARQAMESSETVAVTPS